MTKKLNSSINRKHGGATTGPLSMPNNAVISQSGTIPGQQSTQQPNPSAPATTPASTKLFDTSPSASASPPAQVLPSTTTTTTTIKPTTEARPPLVPFVNRFQAPIKKTGEVIGQLGNTIKNTTENIIDNINTTTENLSKKIQDTSKIVNDSTKTAFEDVKQSTSNLFSTNSYKESSSSLQNSLTDFLNSNDSVSRFAFVILILFLFIFLVRIGVNLIAYFLMPKDEPDILRGMIDSKQMMIIEQDPSKLSSIPIKRSVNRTDGIEFSWSVWMNITDITYNEDKFRHVFNKGNSTVVNDIESDNYGMIQPNNAPGLYITPYKNNLMIVMNTFNTINEKIEIEEIPLNKWLCVIIRCENKTVDVFINGTLVKRHILSGVPKQNYDNINLSLNGGFGGYTSSLKYYDRALNILDITGILYKGPNKKIVTQDVASSNSSYISTRWYFNENLNV